MASTLTGRFLQINVHPFSFKEFVDYSGLKQYDDIALPSEIGKLSALFIQYQTFGGFPETVINPAIHKNYLGSLFDSVLLRDIVKRFKIRQTQHLYDLSVYLLSNYTNQFSFNQLKTDLGFNSVATVQKFCSYLEESFFFFYITR
jgi:predicted AAA+ superfamily ATPase